MSAIGASSAGVKDMADGSLRITVEFEPRFAKDAYALFGARGTPLAIAALKTGYAVAGEPSVKESLTPETPKGGALAKLAGMWCADKTFQSWLGVADEDSENRATLSFYELCDIRSRRELDHDPAAAERFNRLIRGPYMKWRASKGLA